MDWITPFRKAVEKDIPAYREDYNAAWERVQACSARYQGRPMNFMYQPMLFEAQDIERFIRLSSTMTDILRKVIRTYRESAACRAQFGFSPLMESLILADPGYQCEFPMARFDVFYEFETGNFTFCELNADGSSSMNESRELGTIIAQSRALDAFKTQFDFSQFELFDAWIDVVLSLYHESEGPAAKQRPFVVIADFEGEGIVSEFEIFKKRFIQRGCDAEICDPRELTYKNHQLLLKNKVVDVIYRRATTARVVQEAEHVRPLLDAYLNRDVVIVGGFVSQLIHNKVLFALLHDMSESFHFSQEEKAFIKKHIPYTVRLEKAEAHTLKSILENKEQWILKPYDQYAAHGIRVGQNYSDDQWRAVVDTCRNNSYLAQAFFEVPQLELCVPQKGSLSFEPFRHMIGLFMYNQKFAGTYIRVGRKPIIASHGGESLTMAGFVVKER